MHTSGTNIPADRATILFADADDDTLFAYQSLAAAEGFGAELARDGHEAITLANVFLPDALVIETRLPGLSGFDVIHRLRAATRTREMIIVIVSGQDGEAFQAQVRASGCDACLKKPSTMSGLLRLMQVVALKRCPAVAPGR